MGIVVLGAVFVDIKGYPLSAYIPGGRNAGRIEQVHGGVSRNVVEDIANVELRPTFVSLVDDTGMGQDVINKLKNHKVNTKYIQRVPDGMGTWLAIFDNDGDVHAAISKRPDTTPLTGLLKEKGDEIFADCDAIALELDLEKETVKQVLHYAKKYHKKVFAAISNMSIAMERRDFLQQTSCFVCNLQEAGILLRRRYNDYTHTTDFTVLNPIEGQEWAVGDNIQVSLTVKVPACRWHKKGVPYLDTFYSLHLTEGNLELRNTEGDTSIASCRSTEGCANRRKYVCPKCGKIHPFPDMAFCKNCQDMFYISTVFGKVLKGTSVEYKGKKYPSFLFKKGRPVPEFRRYLQIEKLFIS